MNDHDTRVWRAEAYRYQAEKTQALHERDVLQARIDKALALHVEQTKYVPAVASAACVCLGCEMARALRGETP